MANKHFEEYYKQIERQYFDILQYINEIKPLIEIGEMSQAQLESFMGFAQPVIDNYEAFRHVKRLLDIPNRKKKAKMPLKRFIEDTKNDKYAPQNIILSNRENLQNIDDIVDEMLQGERI